jgi:hypothetical protein
MHTISYDRAAYDYDRADPDDSDNTVEHDGNDDDDTNDDEEEYRP